MSDQLERLAAGCLLPSFPGVEVPDWARRFLARGGASILFFAYNAPTRDELANLVRGLRAERGNVLLAIDEEGGDVTRLEWREGSSYPSAAGLGAVDDVALTEEVAAAIAADLTAVGVNWDFAPVADLNVPGNPVIGVRAFGDEATAVAPHVAAFVRGLQRARVAACAKHFPGHGATEADSHLELPVVTGDPAAGLEPFRAAIGAGVRTIMTAHVVVPSLGDEPATLNPRIVTGLLREELGFDGLVVADALEMRAVSATVGVEAAAVRALRAGVDLLCVGHDLDGGDVARIEHALVAAVRAGELAEERLVEAAARVAALAEWAVAEAVTVEPGIGASGARRAVRVSGDSTLAAGASIVELRPRANIAAGEHEHRFAGARVVREGEPVPAADAYVVRDAHRHAWMRDAADREGVLVIEVGLPVWRPERARGYVATYGAGRASLSAAADALQPVTV
ncbi:MAG TPA: glycoside hydrolase family 3 N-terminal domain-containing protein [Gaiellaceae bacterium]